MLKSYKEIEHRFAEIGHLRSIHWLLFWDSNTMMPPGGASSRADQMATLERLKHGLLTAPAVSDLLDRVETKVDQLDDWQQMNLREMRRIWRHAIAVDADLMVAINRAKAVATIVWAQARKDNDFVAFKPALENMVTLQREMAEAKGEALNCRPYDALLDQWDPGTTTLMIDELFEDLEAFLPDFANQVQARQQFTETSKQLVGPISREKQELLVWRILKNIGYTIASARLDNTAHPFTLVEVPGDARIATRYDEDDFSYALMTSCHEAGHAIYEQNLPEEWRYQPVGYAQGFSTHESQALCIEMMACRSQEFLEFLIPHLREVFGLPASHWSDENLINAFQKVASKPVRVGSDEVTYILHIILRYRIERNLLMGDLLVGDLPEVWNENMKAFLGIQPGTDADGCLQDNHWAMGLFGYFPNYALGALKAAQLFSTARQSDPTVLSGLKHGNFTPWLNWLKENVHEKASYYSNRELMQHATGSMLDTRFLKEHLRERYLAD